MNRSISAVILAGFLSAAAFPAAAEMLVHILYDNSTEADVKNPSAGDHAVVLAQGVLSFSRINRIDFNFGSNAAPQTFEALLKDGQFEQLDQLLTSSLKLADPFLSLPGNLDTYLIWQMKTQFWSGRYAEVLKTADLLKQRNPALFGLAGMYITLALIEQGHEEDARLVFTAVEHPESVSAPMALFVKARLAMAKKEYREALQDLARIVVFYARDPEWMPAATLYEGLVYKRTGYLEASGNVAKEMSELYPSGYWSRRLVELKGSKTE